MVIDKQTIADAYDQLTDCFPFARIYYAVKANPATEITELLRDKGSNFDIASIYELDKVMKTGVGPERISYGNTIKKSKDIRYFYEKGVRLFATDSKPTCATSPRPLPAPRSTCVSSPRARLPQTGRCRASSAARPTWPWTC